MNKRALFKVQTAAVSLCFYLFLFMNISCSSKESNAPQEIDVAKINHTWYYFTTNSFTKTDLPQHAPAALEKPWTEAIRISSAASIPTAAGTQKYTAFAIVNRSGVLACAETSAKLFCDASIFSNETADALVFSDGSPVFNLYQNSFFNENISFLDSASRTNAFSATKQDSNQERPFLVQFNPKSNICYPLVSYGNLNLTEKDQITGYFWDGRTWECSVKQAEGDRVSFTYFGWQPLIPLTDLSPALTSNQFSFSKLSEAEYRSLNMPKLFSQAPDQLKHILSSLPSDFSFYISWRDDSGTSPVSYFEQGNGGTSVNASAALIKPAGYAIALFADGTTYVDSLETNTVFAFRLPKLPAGYTYGDFAVAGSTLYAAWEQSDFYKTGRAGFLTVALSEIEAEFSAKSLSKAK